MPARIVKKFKRRAHIMGKQLPKFTRCQRRLAVARRRELCSAVFETLSRCVLTDVLNERHFRDKFKVVPLYEPSINVNKWPEIQENNAALANTRLIYVCVTTSTARYFSDSARARAWHHKRAHTTPAKILEDQPKGPIYRQRLWIYYNLPKTAAA